MAESSAAAQHAWSSAQLVRLESEWRRLQRAFAFHPHVDIVPLAGDPPGEYQVRYIVTTLALDPAGQLAYVGEMPVHLWLPANFPREAPVVRPLAAAFHPNVSAQWVHLSPPWRPGSSLAELVTQIGELLAFQTYDPGGLLNPVALNWAYANQALLPTDKVADFSPEAGGQPLERVARFGPGAIDEQRRKVEAMCDRLVSAAPPGEQEVRQFARGVRLALAMFADPDVPESLRRAAAEVEETVLSMGGPNPVWAQIARQVSTAEAAGAAVEKVKASEEAIRKALAAFTTTGAAVGAAIAAASEPASGPEPRRRGELEGRLPPLSLIQPLALELRRVVREADGAIRELRDRLGQLAPPPRAAGVLPGRMLARRLEREATSAAEAAEPARASGAALASVEPVLDVARHESAAVDRVAAWAEYVDLMTRGDEIVRRLTGADPARLDAFFATAAAGEVGPLEYEQPVELAGVRLAASNPRGRSLRIIDPDTEELVASGDGEIPIPLRGPQHAGATLVLHPGERTDELRVQIEYLHTQTREGLARLTADPDQPPGENAWETGSWAAGIAAALLPEDVRRRIVEAHRHSTQQWKALLGELAALGRFRQRLATCHLLDRLIDFVPKARARSDAAKGAVARAEARLAEIAARSGRDAATDALIVPQQFAAEYADRLVERDRAAQEIARAAAALQVASDRARVRLGKPRLVGSAEAPALRLLAPLPPHLANASNISDAEVEARAGRLEALIGVKLRDGDRGRSDSAAAARPAARIGGS